MISIDPCGMRCVIDFQFLRSSRRLCWGPAAPLLSIREYHTKPVADSDAATGMTSIAFQERRVSTRLAAVSITRDARRDLHVGYSAKSRRFRSLCSKSWYLSHYLAERTGSTFSLIGIFRSSKFNVASNIKLLTSKQYSDMVLLV